ncbi:MAG: hypothetical protein ACE5D3_05195, partial [Candidatus Binatia bacterium]
MTRDSQPGGVRTGPPPFSIQGREVRLPCEVRRASSITATYLVSAARAREFMPTDAWRPAELLPGRALF